MSENQVRKVAASVEANNNDVFMWAVYLLGGADRQVDVEDIYVKAFELAPARLGWRTRPQIPNFKKTAKALQAIEAKTHVGLLQKFGANNRRLTPAGVAWIKENETVLRSIYSGEKPVEPAKVSDKARLVRAIKESTAWESYTSTGSCSIESLAFALKLTPASTRAVWNERLADLSNAAQQQGDSLFSQFATYAAEFAANKIGEQ